MTWAQRLERLVPDLAATFARFPIPVAISLLLCGWLNIIGGNSDHDGRVATGAAAAFIAAGAFHLLAEGRKLQRGLNWFLALAAAIAVGLSGYLPAIFHTNTLFLFAGLLPLLMIAPFMRSGVSQGAIWLFNLRFGLAALLAAVVALLFALGLSAIVEALNVLFGAGISGMHEHIWFTAASLIGPLYGLSLMPRELDEEVNIRPHSGSLLDRGISVLVNYVAVPVIAVYALILHAYAVKILIEGELPRGQIGIMVTIFAIGGTACWLIAWPWREQGTKLLRLFMQGWFFLLIVPTVLLAMAIWRRLVDYGVTPDRYGIALVAVWVGALVLYLAIRRNRADMRAILGAVGVLLVIGSVGPMGANGLTISSQFKRLVALLETSGVLKDGKINPKGLLPSEAGSTGSSIVYALNDAGGLDRLKPWFEGDPKDPFAKRDGDWALAQVLNERLGFAQADVTEDHVNFYTSVAGRFTFPEGAELFGPFQDMRIHDAAHVQQPMTSASDKEDVIIKLEDKTYRVAQKRLLEAAKSRPAAKPGFQQTLSVEIEPGVTMLIDQLSGNLNAKPSVNNLRFWLIRRRQP